MLQDETKHCKPNDVNADTPVRYMTSTSYTNESDSLVYGSVAANMLLPPDAMAGDKYKFVVTLFGAFKSVKKFRFPAAIYVLDAADVSDGSLSFELFRPVPHDVDLSNFHSIRLKVKKHDPNPHTRYFVRNTCARENFYTS